MATPLEELQKFNDLIIANSNVEERLPFQEALDAVGVSIDDFKVVHVAGTNGKSSVCYKVAAGLELLGHSVGLFISPHIWRFNERIMVHQRPIKDGDLLSILKFVSSRISIQGLHFFSIYLLVALVYFKRCNAEWVVLETGIGGTHDKTNWGRRTRVAVVTSIGYDHMHILGYTLEQIARQKAGIIKSGCTLVMGPNVQPSGVFQEACHARGAKMIQLQPKNYATYDAENSDIARAVLEQVTGMDAFGTQANSPSLALRLQRLSPSQIERARLHMIANGSSQAEHLAQGPPELVFDVAHNASAIDRLYTVGLKLYIMHLQDIAKFNTRPLIVCAAVSDNRHIDILNPARCLKGGVAVVVKRVYILPSMHTRIKSIRDVLSDLDDATRCNDKGAGYVCASGCCKCSRNFLASIKSSIKQWCQDHGDHSGTCKVLVPEALPRVMHDAYVQAAKNQCLLLITGSFYIMQEACNALGFDTI